MIWKLMDSKYLTIVLVILIGFLSFRLVSGNQENSKPKPKEEPTVEERINKLTDIEDLEAKAKREGGYFLDKYYRLENQFFSLLNLYYGGETPEEEVRSRANYLIKEKEFLEEHISN